MKHFTGASSMLTFYNVDRTRMAFKKASNGSFSMYDLLSLINLQVECNLPTPRYNTGYNNELLRVKKTNIYSAFFRCLA